MNAFKDLLEKSVFSLKDDAVDMGRKPFYRNIKINGLVTTFSTNFIFNN